MNVQNMSFANRSDVIARLVTLLIFIEVDDGDNLLLGEVVDVRLTADVEC